METNRKDLVARVNLIMERCELQEKYLRKKVPSKVNKRAKEIDKLIKILDSGITLEKVYEGIDDLNRKISAIENGFETWKIYNPDLVAKHQAKAKAYYYSTTDIKKFKQQKQTYQKLLV